MAENKQITIYDLLPLIKTGWVFMDKDGSWYWDDAKPISGVNRWTNITFPTNIVKLNLLFNIAPFDGDWKDSLMEVK